MIRLLLVILLLSSPASAIELIIADNPAYRDVAYDADPSISCDAYPTIVTKPGQSAPINILPGATFHQTITPIRDGIAQNYTGHTCTLEFYTFATSTASVLDATVIPTSGKLDISITATQTAALLGVDGYFFIRIVGGGLIYLPHNFAPIVTRWP
jgi:hypothetical protein